jgi:hypothetical protein
VQQRGVRSPASRDSVRLLQNELGRGYLARGLYYITTRRMPVRGCADLAQAVAAGLAEAPALQQQYCR